MRLGYFGPEGTFTHEALNAATTGLIFEPVALPTIYDAVMAVHAGIVDQALVPIENSLEGSVNATLDTLAMDAQDVSIVGEVVLPISHCLIAREEMELSAIEVVVSHPQANAQCARFIRDRLPRARVEIGSSTAEAVRTVATHVGPWAALGNRVAAERYGCRVLEAGVEDAAGNETRFVWLAPAGTASGGPRVGGGGAAGGGPGGRGAAGGGAGGDTGTTGGGAFKTAIVFWGVGSEAPGWLVACLDEFAQRGVNLTRIESRPRKLGLGRYMFFADLEGGEAEDRIAAGLAGLRAHVHTLRVLGSFPAA
jgi:prephenate dehydratase